jgi:biopolymer transport protein ExbD
MTPMVDIAFLFLIFFMVATVFLDDSHVVEIILPPATPVRVPDSNVLAIEVGPGGDLQWQMGSSNPLRPTSMQGLHRLFIDQSRFNPDLIVLVKLHRSAPYGAMVGILDEIRIAGIERFSLVPMEEESTLRAGAG